MNFLVALVAALGVLPACGVGKCAGPYTGTWTGTTTTDQLTLGASCEYQYRGNDGCQSSGTYGAPLAATGQVLVTIQSATPGSCLGVGNYQCNYSASSSVLTVDCGAGAFSYGR